MSVLVPESIRREYGSALGALAGTGVPFVVGGAWALDRYAQLGRSTLDLDLMVAPSEVERCVQTLRTLGGRVVGRDAVQTRVALRDSEIDLVHHIAQGEYEVDSTWYQHGVPTRLFDVATLVAAPEELLWSKVFIAARHRFDGSDIVHLIRATGQTLDWNRLHGHLAPYPRLLLAYLTLFGFCYPSETDLVPRWLWEQVLGHFVAPVETGTPTVCRGTLLDSQSFEFDLVAKGLVDVRPKGG